MKLYKKSELSFRHGMLISKDGDVVAIDNEIVDLANEMETKLQASMYLRSQPEPVPERNIDGFQRESMEADCLHIKVETPLLDCKTSMAMALMDELDDASIHEDANKLLQEFQPFVSFVMTDEILGIDGQTHQHKFDTPTFGNPLTIDKDAIVHAAMVIAAVANDNYTDDIEVRCISNDESNLEEWLKDGFGKGMEIDPSDGVDPYEQEQTEGNESGD